MDVIDYRRLQLGTTVGKLYHATHLIRRESLGHAALASSSISVIGVAGGQPDQPISR
jgi:hypothetical protein